MHPESVFVGLETVYNDIRTGILFHFVCEARETEVGRHFLIE